MDSLSLPFSGVTPISRHHSALAAEAAQKRRGEKTLTYLRLLDEAGEAGLSDHEVARMAGWPLSSVNSIRNGCGVLIEAAERRALSPHKPSLYVTCWRRRTA